MYRICFHSNQCALVSPEYLRSVVLQILVSELSMSLGFTCIKWEFSKLLVNVDTSWSQLTKINSPGLVKTKALLCKCLGKLPKILATQNTSLFSNGEC